MLSGARAESLAESLIPFARSFEYARIVRVDAIFLIIFDQRRIQDLQRVMGAQVFANVGAWNENILAGTLAFDSTRHMRINFNLWSLRRSIGGFLCRSKPLPIGTGVARVGRLWRFRLGKSTLKPAF